MEECVVDFGAKPDFSGLRERFREPILCLVGTRTIDQMRRAPCLLLEGAALRCSGASPEVDFCPMIFSIHLGGDAVDRLKTLTP